MAGGVLCGPLCVEGLLKWRVVEARDADMHDWSGIASILRCGANLVHGAMRAERAALCWELILL